MDRSPRARGYYGVLASLGACAGVFLASAGGQQPSGERSAPTTQGSGSKRHGGAQVARVGGEQRVVDAAECVRRAVVHLTPTGGTGFVVSRSRRLILTAGHAADFFREVPPGERALYALPEGSARPIPIEKVWYHPRIRRELDYGLVANSLDPKDGDVAFPSPDLALIQLSQESGELPLQCEVQIQIQTQPRNLNGCAVGALGFWGAGEKRSVDAARREKASFLASVIRRANEPVARTAPEYREFVFMDAPCSGLGGISGGPIFLASGLVVALATNSDECGNGRGEHQELVALRTECFAELVAYHKLDGWFPGLAKVAPRADWGPSPRIEKLRSAAALGLQARALLDAGIYNPAVEVCNKALSIAPEYGGALFDRSKAYLFVLDSQWDRMTDEERRQISGRAVSDSQRCNEMDPSSNEVYVAHLQNMLLESRANSEQAGFRRIVQYTTGSLSPEWREPLTIQQKAFVLNIRAQSHRFLGETVEAEGDYGESIRANPDEPRWYWNRAQFWDETNRHDLARADRAIATLHRQGDGTGGRMPPIPLWNDGHGNPLHRSPFDL
jgi:tetratricopeptide (TPR) repeat protein